MTTIDQVRRALTARFAAASIDTPALDARFLIGHALGLDLTGLVSQAERLVGAAENARLEALVLRRLAGEPVARIMGSKEFWGLPLSLSHETLVPRPDTETVVSAVLRLIDPSRPLMVADFGTGSGAILLALLSECPRAVGVGTDISIDALTTARVNARDLGLADRAGFVSCNYGEALHGPFDLIVSNPPYIRSSDIAALDKDVRDHDPLRALDGGADGLDAYRSIAKQCARLLKPGGIVVVEVGRGQADDVQAILAAAGLPAAAGPERDIAGIPRAVAGRNG